MADSVPFSTPFTIFLHTQLESLFEHDEGRMVEIRILHNPAEKVVKIPVDEGKQQTKESNLIQPCASIVVRLSFHSAVPAFHVAIGQGIRDSLGARPFSQVKLLSVLGPVAFLVENFTGSLELHPLTSETLVRPERFLQLGKPRTQENLISFFKTLLEQLLLQGSPLPVSNRIILKLGNEDSAGKWHYLNFHSEKPDQLPPAYLCLRSPRDLEKLVVRMGPELR
jgi:hypothetical protein